MSSYSDKPYDQDFEESVLSALLHAPEEIVVVRNKGGDEPRRLVYDDINQGIWRSMLELHEQDRPIDPTSVLAHVTQRGYLSHDQAENRLERLVRLGESPDNVDGWGDILADLKERRSFYDLGRQLPNLAQDMDRDLEDIRELVTHQMSGEGTEATADAAGDVAVALRDRIDGKPVGEMPGTILTGMPDLDNLLDGVYQDDFVAILSRPGWGKTSLMVQLVILQKMMYPNGIIDIFETEMSSQRLINRMAAQLSGVRYGAVKTAVEDGGGSIPDEEREKIQAAMDKIAEWGGDVRIYNKSWSPSGITQAIQANALRAEKQDKTYLSAWVDNFHRLSDIPKREQKNKAIKDFKSVALETQTPVFMLGQLNRRCENENRPPVISDAKGTGQFEQDADRVLLIDRPDERNPHLTQDELKQLGIRLGWAIIDAAKNREAKSDHIERYFHGATMQFLPDKPSGGPPAVRHRDTEEEQASEEEGPVEATAEEAEAIFA